MAHNVSGTFVSEKINKIRWKPDFLNESHFFLSGSWDNDQNHIKLWDFKENEEEAEVYPYLVTEFSYSGDVTELKFLNSEYFVSSSSSGTVHLMKVDTEIGMEPLIDCKISWEDIHRFPSGKSSPCTSFSTYENDIASVGEDGSINLLNSQSELVARRYENADSCTLTSVIFLKHCELLTSNFLGHMKIWDIRSSSNKPSLTFVLSQDQITPTCLEYHPTQRHIVLAGDEEGSITIWDLRQHASPINSLDAHSGSVSEMMFHPNYSDQLFSCSSAGEVWHWSPKSTVASIGIGGGESNFWLSSETVKNKLEVYTLMPKLHMSINSLDVNRGKVLCGCENEAVYLINGINISN